MRILWAAALVLMGGEAIAAPKLLKPITSNDQIGFAVTGKTLHSRGAAAMLGMWSEDGALELAGFQDRNGRIDAATIRAAEIVSGRAMQSRGVRVTGSLYRAAAPDARGWTLSIDARRQQVGDIGAALSGDWRSVGESRLTLGGRLKF